MCLAAITDGQPPSRQRRNARAGRHRASTLLTTIVSLDPIYIYFDMDEATYLKNNRSISRQRPKLARDAQFPCSDAVGETKPSREGKMDFLDNRWISSTGTPAQPCVVPNKDLPFFRPVSAACG